MNIPFPALILALQAAAALQLGVAVLNLFLIRLLHWCEDLRRAPLLMQEVFQVHVWFISITLALFGVMTWNFAGEIVSGQNAVARWLAAGIGIFWAVRAVIQITYYSASHWRGLPGRTAAHIALLLMYGGFAALYLCLAIGHP